MKQVIQYIRRFFSEVDKRILLIVTVFTAVLIWINYHFLLDDMIRKNNSFIVKLIAWYPVFLVAFAFPYCVWIAFSKKHLPQKGRFFFLLFFAPLIFSVKLSLDISFHFSDDAAWNSYWNHIIYWPLLLVIVLCVLLFTWRYFDRQQPFYGFVVKGMNWKPYFIMLLCMVPLIALASTQADFLATYPKLRSVTGLSITNGVSWWQKLLYELSYGTDFISIELFFRGFLILAFIKWAGKDAILPMACFYCTIHFGKPLGECLSSYFGGMLLGIVVYNTRSILGGLLVHLGIAWMMEIGGYIGHS